MCSQGSVVDDGGVQALVAAVQDSLRFGSFMHSNGVVNESWLDMRCLHSALWKRKPAVNQAVGHAILKFVDEARGRRICVLLPTEVSVGSEDHLHVLDDLVSQHLGLDGFVHVRRRPDGNLVYDENTFGNLVGKRAMVIVGLSVHMELIRQCCELARRHECCGLLTVVHWSGSESDELIDRCAACGRRYRYLVELGPGSEPSAKPSNLFA